MKRQDSVKSIYTQTVLTDVLMSLAAGEDLTDEEYHQMIEASSKAQTHIFE